MEAHTYEVQVIHAWISLDAGEINYPGDITVIGRYASHAEAQAAANEAKAATPHLDIRIAPIFFKD